MPIRCNNGRGIQINQQACSIDISYCGCSTSEIKSSSLFLLPHNSFFLLTQVGITNMHMLLVNITIVWFLHLKKIADILKLNTLFIMTITPHYYH